MSRFNVGTVSIGVVADAGGVGAGVDQTNKEIAKIPGAANDAERKLDKLTRSFNELARAAQTAKTATGSFSNQKLNFGPPGLRSPGNLFGQARRSAGQSIDLDYAVGTALLAGAKEEREQFQKAEQIFGDLRRRGQKLQKETAKTFGVLAPGKLTREQRDFLRQGKEESRVARQRLLTGDSYGLLNEGPAPAPAAPGIDESYARKRSRIAFSLAEQRRKEEAGLAADAANFNERKSYIAFSLAEQRRKEQQQFAQRRSRVAFSLAEQRRQEEANAPPSAFASAARAGSRPASSRPIYPQACGPEPRRCR